MSVLHEEQLREFAGALLTSAGVDPQEAELVARSLVGANLRGHDSHGVVRVKEYVGQIRQGELIAGAELETTCETDSLLVTDAHFGFGQVQCKELIRRLVPKARRQGIACGTLRNSGHVGRLGEWGERIAAEGLAGLVTVNDNGVLQCVAPPGGIGPRISTNPVTIGVPTGGEPLVLDISTSAVANGKIHVRLVSDQQCPEGWLQDAEGNPTTDPSVRFSDPRGSVLPMGGEQGYKGFGLGLLLDVLVGGLSGGFCPPADETAKATNNVLVVIWDPQRFAGQEHFLGEADKLIDYVRSTRRKPGVDAIRLPGDRSTALRRERLAEGIPLDVGTWQRLIEVAGTLGVDVPAI